MDARTKDELAALELRMRDLIHLLDGAQTGIEALERAWSTCAEHGPALERAARTATNAAGEERVALRTQLERLVHLNAAARQAIEREEARIATDLARVNGARTTLAALGAVALTGESCDVSG